MHAAYSYRRDTEVPTFDDSRPLIIFDGLCVLCSSGVGWMLRHDPQGSSRFAAIQETVPRALYKHYGLNADTFDTFMVLRDGVALTRWAGVIAAGLTMAAPWRWLARAGGMVPAAAGDAFYDWVQRNRLRWFGSRDTCFVPDACDRSRFFPTEQDQREAFRPPS